MMRPMRAIGSLLLALALAVSVLGADLAPTGTLRAAFIADNPIQGRVDPRTGEASGVAADLSRELARRLGVALTILPLPNPAAVIDSVRTGTADIGFLAYEPDRAGLVAFSRPYLLSPSAYLVRADSDIRTSADVDRAGVTVGAAKGASQQIYVSATLARARVDILPAAPAAEAMAALIASGRLDAFAANRQRLEDAARTSSQVRILEDDFMVAEQAIVVAPGDPSRVADLNSFLGDLRATGVLKTIVDRADLGGVALAP
jgi:polar amino acid transport system substrate-binding protein